MSTLAIRLQAIPLFTDLSVETLKSLEPNMTLRQYPPGQALLMEDTWGSGVYFLLSGWVRIQRQTPQAMQTLAIMGSPSFFGEMAILDKSHRVTDVITLTTVETVLLPSRSFTQLLLSEAKISYKLAQIMAQRLRQINQLFYLKDQSVAVKIVYILVQLAESYGHRVDQKVELFRVSLEDLASLAQVSLEDVKISMDRFLKQGLIQVDPTTQTLVLNNYNKFLQATQVI